MMTREKSLFLIFCICLIVFQAYALAPIHLPNKSNGKRFEMPIRNKSIDESQPSDKKVDSSLDPDIMIAKLFMDIK